jgi:hypothetical protein
MIQLSKGTIEHLPVSVRDRLGNLTTLDGVGTTFIVRRETDRSEAVAESQAETVGLTAFCLIDTNDLAEDRYELLVRLNISGSDEVPLLGPFDFEVI